MEPQQDKSLFDTNLDSVTQNHLLGISKWTKFISLSIAIAIALFIVAMLAIGSQFLQAFSQYSFMMGSDSILVIVLIFLVIFAIMGVWLYFLYRTSTKLRKGLETRSSTDIADGLKSLKIFFVISFVFSLLSLLTTITTMFKS